MALVWATFTDSPSLNTYQSLKQHAERAKAWPEWREGALSCLRDRIAQEERPSPKERSPWTRPRDHSILVEVFLWEKDVGSAWREAQEGGCSNTLWMQLARLREAEHPVDAIPIYQAEAARLIERKNNDAYREATRLIRKTRELMEAAGQGKDSAAYLARVREEHKRKRNLMKLLGRLD